MNPVEAVPWLYELGLHKSVETICGILGSLSVSNIIIYVKSLIELRLYQNSLDVIDDLLQSSPQLTSQEESDIIDLQLTCYLAINSHTKCANFLGKLRKRQLTLKQHILVAKAYLIQDTTRSASHPAIPHLLEVLNACPYAIELIERLLSLGCSVAKIISTLPQSVVRQYIDSIQLTSAAQYSASIDILKSIPARPHIPAPILNQILINAVNMSNWSLFDETARLLPPTNLAIVDLRALRLKELQKGPELEELVANAIHTDMDSAASWLAMSYLKEYQKDIPRSICAARKAIQLDPRFRRAYMRYGDLRFKKSDVVNALESFMKAHMISSEIDSYRQIVECYYILNDQCSAESFSTAALNAYPAGNENHGTALTLYAISIQDKDTSKAAKCLVKALEIDPANLDALSILADIRLKESPEKAIETMKQYRKKNKDWFYWLKMAEIESSRADYRTALIYIEKCLIDKPDCDRALSLKEQLEPQNNTEGTFSDSLSPGSRNSGRVLFSPGDDEEEEDV